MDAVNKENLDADFKLLREVYDEFNFHDHPELTFNMDETGMPLDARPPKIVAQKGQKKVRCRTSGKKGGCANTIGQAIPPMVIFDAQNFPTVAATLVRFQGQSTV